MKHIPRHYQFPREFPRQIQWYYKYLHCVLIPHRNTFHVVTAIPLAQSAALFHIYEGKALNIPHIMANLAVKYELATTHIAVSKDKNTYILLTSREADKCVIPDTGYCSFNRLIHAFNAFPTCISSLFLQDQTQVNANCKRKIVRHDKFPIVSYLHTGQWLIASHNKFTLHISCSHEQHSILHHFANAKHIEILQ